jgi:hypothetical protein
VVFTRPWPGPVLMRVGEILLRGTHDNIVIRPGLRTGLLDCRSMWGLSPKDVFLSNFFQEKN